MLRLLPLARIAYATAAAAKPNAYCSKSGDSVDLLEKPPASVLNSAQRYSVWQIIDEVGILAVDASCSFARYVWLRSCLNVKNSVIYRYTKLLMIALLYIGFGARILYDVDALISQSLYFTVFENTVTCIVTCSIITG